MGKSKKISPKKVDNKQSKISLFFQGQKDVPDKSSALFTTVNNQSSKPKSKLSLKKDNTKSAAASTNLGKSSHKSEKKIEKDISNVKGKGTFLEPIPEKIISPEKVPQRATKNEPPKCTIPSSKFPLKFATSTKQGYESNAKEDSDKKDVKSVLFQASQIIRSITSQGEDLEDHVTCVPETQFDNSFTSPPPVVSNVKTKSPEKVETESDLESSIIPDTPEEKLVTTKKKTFRSFLSGSTELLSKNTLRHKLKEKERPKNKVTQIKQQKPAGRSLEEALKSVENDLEFASTESFNAMLTGVGFGHGPLIQKKSVCHELKDDDLSLEKQRADSMGCISGTKRLSACGASPSAKRAMRKTPVKRLSPKQKLNAENTNANSDSKPKRVKKFSRNLSSSFSKKILSNQDNFPKDSAEKNINLDADDDLSDLLQTYQSDQISNTRKVDVQSVQRKPIQEKIKPESSPIIPAHDEPDEALDDIISELRDTLTQSNSKSSQFKAKLERSILSEGVSPLPLQAVKRRIPMDQTKSAPATKYGKSAVKHEAMETTEMEVDFSHDVSNKQNREQFNCNELGNKRNEDGTVPTPVISPVKNNNHDYGLCDDLDMSDLQFDEAELEEQEKLERQFNDMSPFKQEKQNSEPKFNVKETQSPCVHFGRCQVKEVVKSGSEVVLELVTDPNGEPRQAILQGFWTDVAICEKNIVHVVGKFDSSGRITISDKENLLIVHPDLLISGTSVVSGIYCMRRAVLNERFKGFDAKNIYMLYGTIIHSFFQNVVQKRHVTPEAIEAVIKSVLEQPRVLHDMYGQGVQEASVVEEIKKYVPQLQMWVEKYLPSSKRPQHNTQLTISRIADIEENVWSPRYGIKGKIDLTVEVKIHDRQKGTSCKLLPLELKTGRPTHSVEHKGQVTLYSMMSSDRCTDPGAGLLLYLKDGSMTTVPADHANKRGLVQLRNELAHHVWQTVVAEAGSGLPQTINSARACSKCPQLLNCAAYQRTMNEAEAGPSHAMNRLVPETLGHLSEVHLEFYRRWVKLMMMELSTEKSTGTAVSELWCKTGWQREKDGLCLSGMLLVPTQEASVPTETGHYRQTFRRLRSHPSEIRISDIGISARDNLVVSAENESLIALTMGAVGSITDDSISLLLDRDLQLTDPSGRLVYRLDKADTYNTMGTNMTNLARLMENNETSYRLREIVVEKKTPEFEVTMSKDVINKVKGIFKQLNKPQKTAILKVLMCKDYVLIKGYPGTGKTSTIVSLVRVLVLLGRSVLLTSYTHSAVDNILLKLIKHDLDFVRLGRAERIHPNVQPYSAELQTLKMKNVDDLANFYESKSVVATTCLGVGSHPIFTRRTFDVCIVDEASQVLQPACLGPLYASRKFVLVGDPLQLPPVVQSNKARESGMAESLFARLDDAGGTYELNLQYRMNADIMRLSNELVYKGALTCGSDNVAKGRLVLTNEQALQSTPEWLQQTLNPDSLVVFLDTSKIPVPEVKEKTGNVQNLTEAQLVHLVVKTCIKGGVSPDEVGVITPYRSQVALVHDLLQRRHLEDVEVNTVDQYQGRDKNCIIVSFVKNTPGKGSGILEDLRRLNVALTRARHKLIMIGRASVLSSYSPLKAVLNILTTDQLPADAGGSCSAH